MEYQKFIDFLKGLMQPMLTIAMVIIFVSYSISGKFSPDQVWQVVVGIMLFWFGYTAFKFGIPKTEDSVKQSDLLGIIKKQQESIDEATYELGESIPAKAVNPASILTKTNTSNGSTVDANNWTAAPQSVKPSATPQSVEPSMEDALRDAAMEAKEGAENE